MGCFLGTVLHAGRISVNKKEAANGKQGSRQCVAFLAVLTSERVGC